MKFTVTLALVILLRGNCDGESIFERTFKILHQGPPLPPSTNYVDVATGWIEQKLDQFNKSDTRKWQMRYFANDQYFEEGGPIFIYVGGESRIFREFITGGHMHDMAKEHRGYLFTIEHRYYGQSRPTSDLRTENLKYLHVRQAMADLAHFIQTVKSNTTGLEKSKVILTGASYSATMVTWFKRLYPDLIVGAWASSAPLFAKVNFIEYKEVCGRSIKLVGGEACYNRIQNGFAELENMLADKRAAEMMALLNLCDNFDETNDLDVWSLFGEISDIFSSVVQTHSGSKIQNACQKIMEGDDDVRGLTNFIKFANNESSNCSDVSYKSFISRLQVSVNREDIFHRQWIYQTCNEYGWYQTSGSTDQPFGTKFPQDLYISMCHDVFGDQFTNETIYKNVDATNEFFGGLNPEVENVYFTHGQLDPWHAMGITDEDKATVIPLHAHCMDFGSITSSDSDEMKASKEKIAELVRTWVKDEAEVDALPEVLEAV